MTNKCIKNLKSFLIIITIILVTVLTTGCGAKVSQSIPDQNNNQIQNDDNVELYTSNQKITFSDKHVERIVRHRLEKPEESIYAKDLNRIV